MAIVCSAKESVGKGARDRLRSDNAGRVTDDAQGVSFALALSQAANDLRP